MGEARAGFTGETVEVVTASPTKPFGFTHEATRLHPRNRQVNFQITTITDEKRRDAMKIVIDDGGRAAAGFKGKAGDCVCRAIAIVTGKPYAEVYQRLGKETGAQRATRRTKKQSASARNGVWTSCKWFDDYMAELGLEWTRTMKIGQGCTVHLKADELPSGGLVVSLSRHMAAVIDGELHDTHDCSRDGTRCVYGYWKQRA